MSIFVFECIKKKTYGVGGPGGIVLSEMSEGKDKYQNISLYLWNLKTMNKQTNSNNNNKNLIDIKIKVIVA